MGYKFVLPQSQDFQIGDTNGGGIVGHIRVKPSGILWAGKGSHVWHGLTIAQLAELAKKHGKEQKK